MRPAYFHPQSNAEPLRVKLNRIPKAKRTEKNADTLIGEVWNHEGLWTVVSSPSESPALHMAGTVVPSRHEVAFADSALRQYQPEEAKPAPAVRAAKAGKPAARP